jgi:hypothetical protein
LLKFLLDRLQEPSRHCKSSNNKALVFKTSSVAAAYLSMSLIEGVVFYTYLNLDGCLLLQAALTSDKKALL